ncbi:LOW QUALITY PROTEIN: golgin subfamily A member 1-like [Brachionichthys hirsutus]|uniref:LOW QUALITY PROTEIN: golgin subfamily A member 1-like n=1 Tax=Brachionichthys hirsutus TaxID=412623 RepID=UPI0036049DA1
MFAKLKKKIAEEAATAPRSGVRIPRTVSKESIASVGADSGDDFGSDGSSSRDDLPAQLLRRNVQIRKLEAKLSDYAEQLRIMQKTKDKLEIALEKHQDSSIKKLQEQNDIHQASRTKMAEGMDFALEKKDQEWMEKMVVVEKEKAALSVRLDEMMEQSFTLFQKRDDLDELEGFQQQELAKLKHMLLKKEEQMSLRGQELQQKEADVQSAKRRLSEMWGELQALAKLHEDSCRLNSELELEREELLLLREEADEKINELEGQRLEMQSLVQQLSEDLRKSQSIVSTSERSLQELLIEHDALKLQRQKAALTVEDRERLITDLRKKAVSLERRLQGDLSQDEHLQELLQEKSVLEECLEESRAELHAVRTNHVDTANALEAQVSRMNSSITELQTLLRHKEDSSRAYRARTDAQIANLEQQLLDGGEKLKRAALQVTEKQQHLVKLQGEWTAEKACLDQKACLLEQQSRETIGRLEESGAALQAKVADLHTQIGEVNAVLKQRTDEEQQCREALNSRQAESVELAKALEEVGQQKDELQTQVGRLTGSFQESQRELSTVSQKLALREESIQTLQSAAQCRQASQAQLQQDVERYQAQAEQTERDKESHLIRLREQLLSQTQQLESCQARISYLEVEVETLTEQLHGPEVCEEDRNGSVTVDDLGHVQKVNRELEQQLSDKNRTIKQLQQRLAELKRTLQKELKIKSEPEAEGKEKFPENRAERQEKLCPDMPTASPPSPQPSSTTVTNTSDLNDSREINFEYLKHVVLKFMSSREAEAYQLIRAVSVLLNFTDDEEDMLKQTLEYKMSWFGSKPSPKGILRPSVSGASTYWS